MASPVLPAPTLLLAQEQQFEATGIDIAVVVGYIVITILIGIWYSNKSGNDDSEGFFLGGRTFTWPLVGFSLLASNMSGSSFVGFAAAGYSDGVNVYNYEWVAAIILIFFAIFILPFYLKSKVFTMPEFLERRFDRRSRYAFSIFTIVANLFVDAAGALYAGGIVIQRVYPDIPLWQIVAGLAIVAAAYTVLGGLSAVVITDTIQAVFLMIGGSIVFWAAINAVDSIQEVTSNAPEGAFSVIQPASDAAMPWPGLLTGVILIGFYFWTCNQVIVQRVLGAKNEDHGRWGLLFAGALKLPNIFLFVLPGVFALTLYPDLDNPDLAFPTLVFDLLPVGIRGIVLAAVLAAIMSSLDSTLNSVSTLVVRDFFETRDSDLSETRQVWIGRVTTAVFAVLATIWAPQIQQFPNIFEYLQSYLSYTVVPVVVVFLAAIFWKKATSQAAFLTLVVGVPLGLVFWWFNEVLYPDRGPQFLIVAGMLFVVWAAFFAAVTSMTQGDEVRNPDLTWSRETWDEESRELADKPWYANYRYLAVGLGLVTLLFVLPWIPGIPNGFGG